MFDVNIFVEALLSCSVLQICFGLVRYGAVKVCDAVFDIMTCYVLTLQSNSNVLWYLFLNIMSFYCVRYIFSPKINHALSVFVFVTNLYLGVLLYFIFQNLNFHFV